MSAPDFTDILNNVHGFLSLAEAELLYKLAGKVPEDGNIVEIGSYQGRSTICLALGIQASGATVWAIDPHDYCTIGDTRYGMEDNLEYFENIVRYAVADTVKTINLESSLAVQIWRNPIDLLWIDGSHEYDDVAADFNEWSIFMTENGKIALHDASGHYPGVTRLLDEIRAAEQWGICEQVDATTVLKRV